MQRSSIPKLGSAELYLDCINPERETASFLHVDQARLQSTPFLDHRTSLGSGARRTVTIEEMIRCAGELPPSPIRLLLHMSFCGSTHLSHLLDESGAALVLKEPHALVDLADWDRTLRGRGRTSDLLDRTIEASLILLSRPWPEGLATVIKPSNWANLPLLRRRPASADDRVLLLTIDPRSFLRAAFRGGRDRLAFLIRAASHFAAARGQCHLVAEAINGEPDPLGQAARIVLTAHMLQMRSFYAFLRTATARTAAAIDYRELRDSPAAAVALAVAHFELRTDEDRLSAAVLRRSTMNAKQPGDAFSIDRQDEADRAVEQLHGKRFDHALSWAATALCSVNEESERTPKISWA